MSHELTIDANGKAEMAYVGEAPWHKLGQQLNPGASIDQWIAAAGMGFEIEAVPVNYRHKGQFRTLPSRVVTVRKDTGAALGVVSDSYKVVQPREVLEFFAKVAETSNLELETAGTLYGGRRYWAMARIGEEALLAANDMVKGYLLLQSSSDGMTPTTGKFGTVRVVCQNTLNAFNRSAGKKVTQRHAATFDAGEMMRGLGIQIQEEFKESMELLREVSRVPTTPLDMVRLTLSVFAPEAQKIECTLEGLPKLVKALKKKHVKNTLALTNGNIIGGDMLPSDSLGLWLQGVTQYVDHRIARDGEHSIDRAAENALFGAGDMAKTRAFAVAQEYKSGIRPDMAPDDTMLADALAQMSS